MDHEVTASPGERQVRAGCGAGTSTDWTPVGKRRWAKEDWRLLTVTVVGARGFAACFSVCLAHSLTLFPIHFTVIH